MFPVAQWLAGSMFDPCWSMFRTQVRRSVSNKIQILAGAEILAVNWAVALARPRPVICWPIKAQSVAHFGQNWLYKVPYFFTWFCSIKWPNLAQATYYSAHSGPFCGNMARLGLSRFSVRKIWPNWAQAGKNSVQSTAKKSLRADTIP